MRFVWSLVFLLPLFSSLAIAENLAPVDRYGCRQWKNGLCVDGALTDLAKGLRGATAASEQKVGSCGKICQDACPNCGKCSLCSFCWLYDSDSCKNVGYYTNRDTCEEKKTASCCDLCEAHCGEHGACSEGEYCRGGDKSTSTIVKCIEQTQGEICEKCTK
jgi:hypothetical protein